MNLGTDLLLFLAAASKEAEAYADVTSSTPPAHGLPEVITSVFMISGALFCLLASIGIVRMPDLYTRMQAAAKAGTLGVGLILVGVGIHERSIGVLATCVLIVAFMFLTAPVASHLIGRAAYLVRVKPWEGTHVDDLAGCYDFQTRRLSSTPDENRRMQELASEGPNFDGETTMFGKPSPSAMAQAKELGQSEPPMTG